MVSLKLTNEHTSSEVRKIIDVLRLPSLRLPTEKDYPAHTKWLEKAEAQIQSGKKRAMVAYSGSNPVGVVIYQRHEGQPATLEIKNISVIPEFRGKGIGSLLLRSSETNAVNLDFPGVNHASVDTKASNIKMIRFLTGRGYEIENIVDLYGLGTGSDAILTKPLRDQS